MSERYVRLTCIRQPVRVSGTQVVIGSAVFGQGEVELAMLAQYATVKSPFACVSPVLVVHAPLVVVTLK